MGFSTTAGFALLFIAGLIAFGVVTTVVTSEIKEINKIIKLKNKEEVELRSSDFKIVNVTAINVTATTYNLTVIINNTGSTTFDCTKFTLLVDGVIVNATCNVSKLYPLEYAKFTAGNLDGNVGSSHRLKVVSDNGIERYTTFVVGG